MQRRDVLKAFVGAAGLGLAGISPSVNGANVHAAPAPKKESETMQYDNSKFYKDGVFQQDAAFEAYFEMFEKMNYSLTDSLRKNANFWVADFGLGDFAKVGMGGIFFFNDKEFRYFGHDIYLLPGQMIPEHRHLAAEGLPAKHEAWQVRHGSIFNFSEGGEKTPEVLAMLPKSQLDDNAITCFTYKEMKVGDQDRLGRLEAPHFMMAGPEGAIVTEYACYHSMDGLRFTNPKGKA